MIFWLMIFSTIYGVDTMKGDLCVSAQLSEFVVSIWYYHEHRCTGSILDERHVLTIGNCVFDLPSSALSVAAGITEFSPRNIQLIPVEKIYFHPDLHRVCRGHDLYWENDVAILELSDTMKWGITIAALPLIDAEHNWDPCYRCQTYGWNDETIDDMKLLTLKWSPCSVMEDAMCNDSNVTLLMNEKCLRNQFQSVIEDGDYGAPVVCGSMAVGIIVRGCTEKGSVSILLNLYPYLDFIANILLPMKINVPGQFPYYVALFDNGDYHCGGAIIDSNHIITAAHCVEESTIDSLIVLFGRREFFIDELKPDEFGLIDDIQRHPNYQRYMLESGLVVLENDIAVLKLRVPIIEKPNVRAIEIADYLPVGHICQVLRWSRTTTREGRGLGRSLSSPAAINDHSECQHINPLRLSTDFCVFNIYSLPIATTGDSGSPIVCDGLVVGVMSSHTLSTRASWGPFQGIYYTPIYPNLKFLEEAVSSKRYYFQDL